MNDVYENGFLAIIGAAGVAGTILALKGKEKLAGGMVVIIMITYATLTAYQYFSRWG